MKIFLGGTCNGSQWREALIPHLKCDFFNPVVKDLTPECQAREIEERKNADKVLYIITPKMTGVYSIAEVVDDSNKQPNKTIFAYIREDENLCFNKHQLSSLQQTAKLVANNGAEITVLDNFGQLETLAHIINLSK